MKSHQKDQVLQLLLKKNKIKGIITDGDIRRMLEKYNEINNISAEKIMTKNPIAREKNFLASKAKKLMNKKISTSEEEENERGKMIIHAEQLPDNGIGDKETPSNTTKYT